MQLRISHDDEAGFERARAWLLDGFDRWLRDDRLVDDRFADVGVGDARVALDWKFGYGDGHLGRWNTGDVTEFLLGWCPSKLSVSHEDSVTIPGSVAAFTDFLAARGLLARGSSSSAALRAAATDAAADFVTEMGDPANFGSAKSLFFAAAARGYDLTDEASFVAWSKEFNSLSDEERAAILPDRVLDNGAGAAAGAPGWPPSSGSALPPLPPVVLPPKEAIEESRASAPVLAMFAQLAEFVGAGRRLTQNGNLSLADAKELVGLLGTGDVIDERIGDKVFRTRSSVDLPVLRFVFTWARKAGVVRVQHGKVLATKRGLAIAANPAGMFDRALEALLETGPVTVQRHPSGWRFWPEIDAEIDSMVDLLLIRPYVERGPVPMAELTEVAAQAILKMYTFSRSSDEVVTTHIGWTVAAAMSALQLAGVVRRTAEPGVGGSDVPGVGGDPGGPGVSPDLAGRRPSGGVELTPAGLVEVRRLLVADGFDAPVAGQWADASAEEMLTCADRDDLMSFFGEIDAWRQRRTPERALAELAAAVRHVDDPAAQNVALTIMSDIGPELAAPYIREMASEGPAVRGFAMCWLADHDMLEPNEVYDPGDLASFAYVLVHRLVTAGDDGLLAGLALVGGETAQAQVVGNLGKEAAPPTEAVLEAIGRTHPAKPVAKAARKALFVLRSRLANQTR